MVSLPVVNAGRVTSVDVAEKILAAGHADVVVMARAYIAEQDLLTKAREGRLEEIRPCIGGNDCISRGTPKVALRLRGEPHVATEVGGR